MQQAYKNQTINLTQKKKKEKFFLHAIPSFSISIFAFSTAFQPQRKPRTTDFEIKIKFFFYVISSFSISIPPFFWPISTIK